MSEMDNRYQENPAADEEQKPEENRMEETQEQAAEAAGLNASDDAAESSAQENAEASAAAQEMEPAADAAETEEAKAEQGDEPVQEAEESAAGTAESEPAEMIQEQFPEPETAPEAAAPTAETAADGSAEAQPAEGQTGDQNVLPLDVGRGEAILEGLLYIVGDDGLTEEQAAETMGITADRARDLFDMLQKKYSDDSYGIEIANYGGIYRFLSKAFVHEYAKKLFQLGKESALSQAALETLAIVAYKQPITRVEIEEIRGVGADMMLRKLMARDLIRESGRSEAPGRPILYEVTEEFMDSFKLLSLSELPELPKFGDDNLESDDLFQQ
jgi:segregation and condensation protein B